MQTNVYNAATHKICPSCGGEFHRDEFGYMKGNGGEKKTKPYCPKCTKEKNDENYNKQKQKRDPFYCEF